MEIDVNVKTNSERLADKKHYLSEWRHNGPYRRIPADYFDVRDFLFSLELHISSAWRMLNEDRRELSAARERWAAAKAQNESYWRIDWYLRDISIFSNRVIRAKHHLRALLAIYKEAHGA